MADQAVLVVCGATGSQGRAVLEALLHKREFRLRALLREPSKAPELRALGVELVQGNWLQPDSLARAFEGAQAVFGVTQPWSTHYFGTDSKAEVTQGKNLVDACKRVGAALVLSTAMLLEDKATGLPHIDSKLEIEHYARSTSLTCTILGPSQFLDNLGMGFMPVKRGKIRGFIDGDAKVPFVACRDIGRAAARCLATPAEHAGKRYNLVTGLYSGEELCAALSKIRGGERFRWTTPPKWLLRIVAPDFYKMRVGFETAGRGAMTQKFYELLSQTQRFLPDTWTLEDFLLAKGFATRTL